jgi:lipoyl(octanoyl) transferase
LLQSASILIVETSRGGQATYHGPGQLVIYPILDLRQWQCDLHWYLRQLEQVIIDALANLELSAERADGYTGVWLEGHKVASIGVAVRGWITYHGVALNVDCDMSGFSLISPCGLSPETMSSLAAHGAKVTVADLMPLVENAFRKTFGFIERAGCGSNDSA